MLKTISYSIVCFSKLIIELEEAKNKKEEPREIKNNDLIFSCVDGIREIKKIFQKVFNNDIDVEKQVSFFSSQYISSNNYSITFETPFSVKISFINKDNVKIDSEQEENIRKIGQELIKSVSDDYKCDTNIIAYIETNYCFVKENVKKNINSFSTLSKENITIPKLELDYKEENGYVLKLKLEEDNTNLVIKAKAKINGSNINLHNNIKKDIENKIKELGI